MSELIDLDKIVGELKPHKVVIKGKTFLASADPSVETLWGMSKLTDDVDDADAALDRIRALVVDIFGEDAAGEVLRLCGPRRLPALLNALAEAYAREGKAPGSSRASRRNGARSKPTSNGSTGSTSAKRASAKNGSAARASSG